MTLKDKAIVERSLGIIEGITFALDNEYAQPIYDAIADIDEIIDKENTDNE